MTNPTPSSHADRPSRGPEVPFVQTVVADASQPHPSATHKAGTRRLLAILVVPGLLLALTLLGFWMLAVGRTNDQENRGMQQRTGETATDPQRR